MKRFLAVTAVLMLCQASLGWAGEERRGVAGAQFLRIAPDARAIGMGHAAVAISDNASALYWNPAGIAGLERHDITVTHVNYLLDINHDFIGLVRPITENSLIGLSLTVLSMGAIEVTTVDAPDGTGATFSPYDLALGLTYTRRMTDRVSVGVTAKFIRESIDQLSAHGLAGDIGFQYVTGLQGLRFGIAMTNFGPRMKFGGDQLNVATPLPGAPPDAEPEVVGLVPDSFELPSELKVGVAYDLLQGRGDQTRLIVSVDGVHPNFAGDRINFGAEVGVMNMLYGRVGYSAADQTKFTEGFSGGGGIKLNLKNVGVRFDYSYSDLSELGMNQRVTVGLAF